MEGVARRASEEERKMKGEKGERWWGREGKEFGVGQELEEKEGEGM